MDDLLEQLRAFVEERDWKQYHTPKNLAMAIGTEAAELMEHFRWVKNDESRDMACDPEVKAKAGEELADILAFVLSFANTAGIDITTSLKAKMAKNDKKYSADQYKGRY